MEKIIRFLFFVHSKIKLLRKSGAIFISMTISTVLIISNYNVEKSGIEKFLYTILFLPFVVFLGNIGLDIWEKIKNKSACTS